MSWTQLRQVQLDRMLSMSTGKCLNGDPWWLRVLTAAHTQGSARAPWGWSGWVPPGCERTGSYPWTSRCRKHQQHANCCQKLSRLKATITLITLHAGRSLSQILSQFITTEVGWWVIQPHLMKGLEMARTVLMNHVGWAMMRHFRFFLSLQETFRLKVFALIKI